MEWHLIAELDSGVQLVADTSEKMAEQLILAGVAADELTATSWKEDRDHALASGTIMAVKFALTKEAMCHAMLDRHFLVVLA
jgi:hypothetical protein